MPDIKQEFTVGHPRALVWARFQDLPDVVSCIPGATLTEQSSPHHAKGMMTVKLGPVRANFAGDAEIAVDELNYTGTIIGSGLDKSRGSRAKGDVTYKLEETPDGRGTIVSVSVDYTLSGSLAQFARGGIVEAIAAQICQDFTRNLEDRLNASNTPLPDDSLAGDAAAADESSEAETISEPDKGERKELNLFALLLTVLTNKIKALFGRR
jgi:uncharacterized protein